MTSSGYHTRRHEPAVLEFESNGALVHFSLSERTNATYVLAKVTPPEGVEQKERPRPPVRGASKSRATRGGGASRGLDGT